MRPLVVLAVLTGLCVGCSSPGSARPPATLAVEVTNRSAATTASATSLANSEIAPSTSQEATPTCEGATPTEVLQTFLNAVGAGDRAAYDACFLDHQELDTSELAKLVADGPEIRQYPRNVFPADAITVFGITSGCDPNGLGITIEKADGKFYVTSFGGINHSMVPGETQPSIPAKCS